MPFERVFRNRDRSDRGMVGAEQTAAPGTRSGARVQARGGGEGYRCRSGRQPCPYHIARCRLVNSDGSSLLDGSADTRGHDGNDSAAEVDRLTEKMRAAGARVTKEPVDAEFFTGRSAYLSDPEGNYVEIAWADMPDNPVLLAARRAAGG